MNTSAEVTLRFGDGEYTFALKLKWIDELQRSVARSLGNELAAAYGVGLGDIAGRLTTGRFLSADIVETIRCGLLGGGMTGPRAMQMIETYVDGRPLAPLPDVEAPDALDSPLAIARTIVQAALFGLNEIKTEGAPTGNGDAAAPDTSTSRQPTDKDSQSGSRRKRSDV